MGITVYLSRQSAGVNPAREALLDSIVKTYLKADFKERSKIFVITPRQNTYQIERELIKRIGDGGFFGLKILDFNGLLSELVKFSESSKEFVDSHGRLMLMKKSIREVKESLSIYKQSADKAGFTDQVISQIGDLKENNISPEMLNAQIENFEGTLLGEKLADLSKIYNQFNLNLGEDRLDENDLIAVALSSIENSDFLSGAQLFFIDNYVLNYSEALFMTLAAKKAKSIMCSLTLDEDPKVPDMTAFIAANRSLKTLEKLCKEENVKLTKKTFPLPLNNSSLGVLSSELFSYQPEAFTGSNNNIKLIHQKDPWDEIIKTAQLILLEKVNGTPFSKIVVAVSDLENYKTLIKRVFSEYQVPVYFDENHQVIDNQFIQTLLLALDCVTNEFNRSDLLAFVKSDFSGFTNNEADLLENYVIEAGVRPWEWKKPFKRKPKHYSKNDLEKDGILNKLRKRVHSTLNILTKKQSGTFSEYVELILKFLEKLNAQEKLDSLSETLSQEGQQELSLRYRQIWNILVEVLTQMETVLGPIKTDLNEFIEIFKAGLRSYEVGTIPEDQDAVIVASLDRTRLPKTDSLYFLGLNEGLLPSALTEELLLTEQDRIQLGEVFNLDPTQIKNKQFLHELEELEFYMFVTKPEKRITFLFSNFSQEGETLEKSRYASVLKSIFSNSLNLEDPKLFPILTPERAQVLMDSIYRNIDPKIASIINDWLREHPDRAGKYISPKEGNQLQIDKTATDKSLTDLYLDQNNNKRLSASRLENYVRCPYGFFISQGLRPTKREEYEVSNLDTGNIIHAFFENFFNKLRESTDSDEEYFQKVNEYLNNKDGLEKEIEKMFEDYIQTSEEFERYNHTATSRYLLKKVFRIVKISILIMLNQIKESGFIPFKHEESFSDFIGDVILDGRIDRIDLKKEGDGTTLRVIDYKTGDKKIDFSDIFYGRSIQLALYLEEALKSLGDIENLSLDGAYYFITNPKKLENPKDDNYIIQIMKDPKSSGIELGGKPNASDKRPNKLNKDELEKILEFNIKQIEKLSEEIFSGNISVNPYFKSDGTNSCNNCKFETICRFDFNAPNANYRDLKDLTKDEFFESIDKEEIEID